MLCVTVAVVAVVAIAIVIASIPMFGVAVARDDILPDAFAAVALAFLLAKVVVAVAVRTPRRAGRRRSTWPLCIAAGCLCHSCCDDRHKHGSESSVAFTAFTAFGLTATMPGIAATSAMAKGVFIISAFAFALAVISPASSVTCTVVLPLVIHLCRTEVRLRSGVKQGGGRGGIGHLSNFYLIDRGCFGKDFLQGAVHIRWVTVPQSQFTTEVRKEDVTREVLGILL